MHLTIKAIGWYRVHIPDTREDREEAIRVLTAHLFGGKR